MAHEELEFRRLYSPVAPRDEQIHHIQLEIERLQQQLDQLLTDVNEDEDTPLATNEEVVKLESEIDALEEHMHAIHDLIVLRQTELERLQLEAEGCCTDIEIKRGRIKELSDLGCEDAPPGPPILRFVEEPVFTLIATGVIIINIVTLLLEALNHDAKDNVDRSLDQFFMVFYTTEVFCKSLYWRNRYLLGSCTRVWWNWLDVLIVVTGGLDMYLMPAIASTGIVSHRHTGTSFLGFMRIIRLARLARVLKVMKLFFFSEFKWVESDRFQMFITSIICINCITLGFQSDFPELVLWRYLNHILLCCFSFELAARLRRSGCSFFCHKEDWSWNLFDFMLVMVGVTDEWALPGYAFVQSARGNSFATASGEMGDMFMILRLARLCRLLRLVRLIRRIPQLYTVVTGLFQAMQGLGWVLIFAGSVLYGTGLFFLKMFGHNLLGDVPHDVRVLFPSVGGSIFTMFNAMNGHYDLLSALWKHYPLMKYFFMAFTVLTSYPILSTMTAVMAEKIMTATKTIEEENERFKKISSKTKLLRLFRKVDVDGDGTVSESEFKDNLLKNNIFKMQLERVTGLDEFDLEYLFEHLSRKPKEKRITPDGRELLKDEFRRRYGRDRGDELWFQSPLLEKRTDQDGEPLSNAEFVKRYGLKRGTHLWGKAPPAPTANTCEPLVSRHDFIEGLLRRTNHVTERQFMRLEKNLHDMQDSIELLVDEILEVNRDASTMGHDPLPQVSREINHAKTRVAAPHRRLMTSQASADVALAL